MKNPIRGHSFRPVVGKLFISNFRSYSNRVQAAMENPESLVESEKEKSEAVGIKEFVGSHHKIWARVKERYADFQVHEIDHYGKTIQLTDIGPPEKPTEDLPYIHFTVYKEGVEHNRVNSFFSQKLKIDSRNITSAGMKDKHARTSQRFCMPTKYVRVEDLMRMSTENLKSKYGNYSYHRRQLKIGQLKGNHFTVLLKNLQLDKSISERENLNVENVTNEAVDNFTKNGFINYYGLQRFSTHDHKIGMNVLQRDWHKVFDRLLVPWPSDHDYTAEAKELWRTKRDAKGAAALIPKDIKYDLQVALICSLGQYYDEGRGDLLKIYRTIAPMIRMLHLSAITSYIWNRVATYRIERFGLEPIPGDFVYVVHPWKDPRLVQSSYIHGPAWNEPKVKWLTKADLTPPHHYTIHDVLLPSIGYICKRYINGTIQKYYEGILEEENLHPEYWTLFKEFGGLSAGAFRQLIVKPQNVKNHIIQYSDVDNMEDHMPSDIQLMIENGKMSPHEPIWSYHHKHEPWIDYSTDSFYKRNQLVAKDKLGAVLDFSLPTGCYATMALREVMQTANFRCWFRSKLN